MRVAIAHHGCSTTTGGLVMAFLATMHDNGRKIAVFGDEATCGECKGSYKIAATGYGMSDAGRQMVVHGDRVLCPCGKNRVIVVDSGMYMDVDRDGGQTRPSQPTTPIIPTPMAGKFTQWFLVLDELTVQPMTNHPYVAHVDGIKQHGTTDAEGYAQVVTDRAAAIHIHAIFAAPKRALIPQQGL